MELKHVVLAMLEAAVWYCLIYYLLLTIKKPDRNLWIASAVLLGLFYLGFVLCLWIRHTPAWMEL